LKEQNPNIKVIGADPYGSIFKTYKETGQVPEATPYLVEGIGQNIPVGNADVKIIDEIINITDRESFEMSRQLGRQEGIFCGGSAGTIFAGALKVAKDLDENSIVVFIVCDTGEHYLTKHHSDEWMKEKLLLEPQKMSAGLICDTKTNNQLFSVSPSETVANSLALMNEKGITQIPIIEDGKSVGSVKESRILTKLLENKDLIESPISEIMEKSFPVVDDEESIDSITRKLQKSPAVLVENFGRIVGIITRADILDLPR
jgi:cystathionine beta-synthase